MEKLDGIYFRTGNFLKIIVCFRSLECNLSVICGKIPYGWCIRMLLHPGIPAADPGEIFFNIGGIYNEKVLLLSHAVDQKVVHNSAVGPAHGRVETLTIFHSACIIGNEVVDQSGSTLSFNHNLSHMGDIKKARIFTYSHMFGDNTVFELNRKFPSAEIYQFYPFIAAVNVIQWSSFQHDPPR